MKDFEIAGGCRVRVSVAMFSGPLVLVLPRVAPDFRTDRRRSVSRDQQPRADCLRSVGLELCGADCETRRPPRRPQPRALRRPLPPRRFCTQANLNGAPELAIMRQSRRKSLDTVRKYIRDRELFRDNPAAKLGL